MPSTSSLDIIKDFGQIAAPAGLAIGVFLYIARDIIARNIFPALTKERAYHVVISVAIMAWTVALSGIGAWVYVTTHLNLNRSEISPPVPAPAAPIAAAPDSTSQYASPQDGGNDKENAERAKDERGSAKRYENSETVKKAAAADISGLDKSSGSPEDKTLGSENTDNIAKQKSFTDEFGLPSFGTKREKIKSWLNEKKFIFDEKTYEDSVTGITFSASVFRMNFPELEFFFTKDDLFYSFKFSKTLYYRSSTKYPLTSTGEKGAEDDYCGSIRTPILLNLRNAFDINIPTKRITSYPTNAWGALQEGGAKFCRNTNASCDAQATITTETTGFSNQSGELLFQANAIIGRVSLNDGFSISDEIQSLRCEVTLLARSSPPPA